MAKFYDTCSLLLKTGADDLFTERFTISSITLSELKKIKDSVNKSPEVQYAARKLLEDLDKHYGEYDICMFKNEYLNLLRDVNIIDNDIKILACAVAEGAHFVTNDLSLKHLAKLYLSEVSSVPKDDDDYEGYLEVSMTNEEMNNFYQNPNENIYNLNINEYIIVRDESGEVVDRLCWTGEYYRPLDYCNFSSRQFGDVRPIKGDVYQQLAADSLNKNKITMIKGPAGSGKTFLSLGFLIYKLERNQIDKIIIFCNTVATKNSARLGFYPGTKDEKLLDSQIGNLLSSKFGGKIMVESMIQNEKLVLLPLSDIRGYDTSNMNAGIYISEAQNLDSELMKLALQRIGEDSICIIDGDERTQVDDIHFAGASNGMRRASKVFRNTEVYGEVKLKNIHRSQIALIAEKM